MNDTVSSFLILGFIGLTLFCIIIMLLRNKAAKKDSVNRSEVDTIVESVSLTPDKRKKIDN